MPHAHISTDTAAVPVVCVPGAGPPVTLIPMSRSVTTRTRIVVTGVAACCAALTGCSAAKESPAVADTTYSGSPASATDSPSSTSPMVGGMTECTKAALAAPATAAAQALGPNNLYTVDRLDCADGWAVTSGMLSSTDNPNMGAPTSFVFEQEGQFWIPKDKAKVCGTNPTTTTAPADALIPAALFLPGCAAG